MKIAVLSGKGGTGKTFVSVNLTAIAAMDTGDGGVQYLDCDVEEPNGHLFFKPIIESEEDIELMLPLVDRDLCKGHKKCLEFCRFNALAYIGGKLKVFEDICHSCGGCLLVCPEGALKEGTKPVGKIQRGRSDGVEVVTGIMNVGRSTGVPIIEKMIKQAAGTIVVIDSPPGAACVVMESIKDADYAILVAEPTVFGAHNLKMVHELVTLFQKPHGVVLNKCTPEPNPSEEYCMENKIPIIARIDFDPDLGLANARGEIVVRTDKDGEEGPTGAKDYKKIFREILDRVKEAEL